MPLMVEIDFSPQHSALRIKFMPPLRGILGNREYLEQNGMRRPLSMTGFGRGEAIGNGKKWTVEVRSVNHRFLDVKIRMPRLYSFLEERMKKKVAMYYSRGHIDISMDVADEVGEGGRLKIDLALAQEYYRGLQAIRNELNLQQEPDLNMLAAFRDIFLPADDESTIAKIDEIWPVAWSALESALDEAATMRAEEGLAMKHDLQERLRGFDRMIGELEKLIPGIVVQRELALKERLANLLAGVDLDPLRLAQEVAVMVDKSDVSEELVRLRSHVRQCHGFFDLDEPIGRRIDFLLQEFLRELNTIAAKISDVEAAYLVVDLKNEHEKMREQAQNIE
jgi:uncharacterized protein (TIGR00255 family)